MNVLWITNIIFPEAQSLLKGNGCLKSSGGWMLGAAESLLNQDDIELHVASISRDVRSLNILKGDRITYYLIPYGKGNLKYNSEYEPYWQQINSIVLPDIVHIHGTEYSHGLSYMKACGVDNVVISIQGLTSAYYYYYYYGMTKSDVFRNITFRDIIRGTVLRGQRQFKERSKYEIEMIQMVHHIMGRTSWDKARCWAINPGAEYHFCNETLRHEFYSGECWEYELCTKHSIFLSQAGYPIKGLHQVLKAMPLILRHFPDATIRIAGGDITKTETNKDRLRLSGYGKYIKRLISKNGLQDKVVFTGNLNASEMKSEYLRANVFVCPSSIENSPNSLGEAQILGVPCLASYVGGIPDMMKGNECGLYRFEEIEMLAYKICNVFDSTNTQIDMSSNARFRHDGYMNQKSLYNIYTKVYREKGR